MLLRYAWVQGFKGDSPLRSWRAVSPRCRVMGRVGPTGGDTGHSQLAASGDLDGCAQKEVHAFFIDLSLFGYSQYVAKHI